MEGVLIFVEQIFIMEPNKLRNVGICTVELPNIVANGKAVVLTKIVIPSNDRSEQTSQSAEGSSILALSGLGRHELIEDFHIFKIIKHIVPDFVAKVINPVQIRAALQDGSLVIRQECVFNVLFGVFKVQYKGTVFSRCRAVQSRERLNRSNIVQLLIHIHRMEQWLIKTSLILVRHNEYVVLATMECLPELFISGDILPILIQVHGSFSERLLAGIVLQSYLTGKGNHYICAGAFLWVVRNISLNCQIIADGICAAVCHNHGFSPAADLIPAILQEV